MKCLLLSNYLFVNFNTSHVINIVFKKIFYNMHNPFYFLNFAYALKNVICALKNDFSHLCRVVCAFNKFIYLSKQIKMRINLLCCGIGFCCML
jgi:hypothetical protein